MDVFILKAMVTCSSMNENCRSLDRLSAAASTMKDRHALRLIIVEWCCFCVVDVSWNPCVGKGIVTCNAKEFLEYNNEDSEQAAILVLLGRVSLLLKRDPIVKLKLVVLCSARGLGALTKTGECLAFPIFVEGLFTTSVILGSQA